MPFITGTLLQVFLMNRGVDTLEIGMINAAVNLVQVAATILTSDWAERKVDICRSSCKTILLQAIIYPCFVVQAALFGNCTRALVWITLGSVCIQTALYACKCVYEYKLLYQIIDIAQYGRLASYTGVAIGISGAGISLVYTKLIDSMDGTLPYFLGMACTELLLLLAYRSSRRLTPVNAMFTGSKPRVTLQQTVMVLRSPMFRRLIIPNLIRGLTISAMNSIAMIALTMGYSESLSAGLSIISAGGYIAASGLYYLLSRRAHPVRSGLLGGAMVLAMAFLPRHSPLGFMLFFLLAYMGRVMVDYTVPVMLYRMIDPQTAGIYHAWRSVIHFASAAAMSYLLGALIGKVNLFWILLPCSCAYLLSMIWYGIYYHAYETHNSYVATRGELVWPSTHNRDFPTFPKAPLGTVVKISTYPARVCCSASSTSTPMETAASTS